MFNVGGYQRLKIEEWGVHRAGAELLPDLWDARCVSWHQGRMLWHGYQHARIGDQKGQPVYFQEWCLEVVDMRPPQEKIKSIFHGYTDQLGPAVTAEATPVADQGHSTSSQSPKIVPQNTIENSLSPEK